MHSVLPQLAVPFWTEDDNIDIFENHPVPVLESESSGGTQVR